MAILQEQNEALAQKRRLAKQKEKARRCRPRKLKRGLGGVGKLSMVKDLRNKQKLNMLGLIETKMQVVTKFDVIRYWGSDAVGWEYVGSDGTSRGLSLMWDVMLFRMNNCYKGERWLCVEGVLLKNNFPYAFCLVYGAHSRMEKLAVWEKLSFIAGLCQVPICYMGDLNEVTQVEERKGQDRLTRSAEDFKCWIQDMQLVDLPLNDHKFTWFRGCSCSRIDRVLLSVEWMDEFPEIRLKGGTKGLLVREKWRNLGVIQFTEKLKALTVPLGRWHKKKFGDMDKKIQRFEEEIRKIDELVANGVYDGTMEAKRKALERSPVVGFRDGLVNRINEEDSIALERLPTMEEIKEAVWDCESSKAPGSDGYNMNFIKKCWDEFGAEFMAAVLDFFQSSRLPSDSNITWVALAPKFTGAKEIKDLRPISMVGCVYKVISKVMVRRMSSVMPGLVGETQSAFVKGRKIHDGALIACETVHWLKTRKKKAAIIKLDFQKAYDRVKWSFVDIVLQKMGFGWRWRE
ncbi:uncharacterized protein LOC107646704 [Arachis ipaensis]|uniref:uncharacterized protein LOC107646704 n=1 Tax=Arachis ipaensis TaxID=130454 RepID=UPI0007AFB5C7|nr:uncharacterized protein LOC107646704 [Arachis ipaensis]XP_025627896.1 uncharacterized protein LOC112721023 [Arachis hypogaea]